MPRPPKWRRVEFIPKRNYFAPCLRPTCRRTEDIQEIQLKVEELEAMRLKDINELNQEECAQSMQVSRQTFQNIIDQARKKVATALVEGKAISVGGGHYTRNVCHFKCLVCGEETDLVFEKRNYTCNNCGSKDMICNKRRCISECEKQ